MDTVVEAGLAACRGECRLDDWALDLGHLVPSFDVVPDSPK